VTNPIRRPVLITGHRGYIGSVMVPHLLEEGYDVVGMDAGYFDDCTLVAAREDVPVIDKDIRDVLPADLRSLYGVIHLAALSNDPIGNLDAGWTEQINYRASVRLAEMARDADVRRFLFSSSCIMYGMSVEGLATEESPLDPQTEYARSKVRSERRISALASDSFSPTFLRNGTVYGLSPRMRFDTVFNSLIGAALTSGRVTVLSDGKPWRPVVHVQDVSRAFQAVLEAPLDTIHDQAFNTGAEALNHRVIDLAEIAVRTVPGADLEVLAQPDADQRTYRTDFGKFARTFPGFEFRWDPSAGAVEVYEAFKGVGLTAEDFKSPRFTRLKWLRHLLDSGRLDGELRWSEQPEAAIR
jgi:nucleoside-diphosphate-sugar epimerase